MIVVIAIIVVAIVGCITTAIVWMPGLLEGSVFGGDNQNVGNTSALDVSTPTLTSVTFYSDGNPNTGETATLDLGRANAGKVVQVKTTYYRDSIAFNNPDYVDLRIDENGYVKITDNTPMPKYPDFCEISVLYDGKECGGSVNIGKYKGTRHYSF